MTSVVYRLGLTLLDSVWQLALIAAITFAGALLFRKRNPRARYALYCTSLMLMLLAPAITFARYSAQPLDFASQTASLSAAGTGALERIADTANTLRSSGGPLLPWIAALWFAGVVGLSLRWTGGWLYLRFHVSRRTTPAQAELAARVDRVRERISLHRAVRVLRADWLAAPAVTGWLRPVLLIPGATVLGLSTDQLEAILAHELAHIRRHDSLVNLLQRVAETLLFFHPVVWWVSRRITQERECCCDELAVRACGDPLSYAKALLAIERTRQGRLTPALAVNSGDLRGRIERILEPAGHDVSNGWLCAPACVAAVLLVAFAFPARTADEHAPGAFEKMRREAYLREYAGVAHLGKYAQWLMEDVGTLITRPEKSEFEALKTDAERDRFIEDFWAARGEEFKERHYRKLRFARSRGLTDPDAHNFLLDRGFFYMQYGPPDEIESHPGKSEQWLYHDPRLLLDFDADYHITEASNPFAKH